MHKLKILNRCPIGETGRKGKLKMYIISKDGKTIGTCAESNEYLSRIAARIGRQIGSDHRKSWDFECITETKAFLKANGYTVEKSLKYAQLKIDI